MAERNVTFTLNTKVDARAKATVDKFSQDIQAAYQQIKSASLPNHRDLRSHQDFARERLRIERSTKDAIVLVQHQAAAAGINDIRQVDAVRKVVVRESDMRMRNLERQYTEFQKREQALRTHAALNELKVEEQAARASLARRLVMYKEAKAREAAIGPLGVGSYSGGGSSQGRSGGFQSQVSSGGSGGFSSHRLMQLSYQLNDVITMLAMGASPMRVLASQGGQIFQILQQQMMAQGKLQQQILAMGKFNSLGSILQAGTSGAAGVIGGLGFGARAGLGASAAMGGGLGLGAYAAGGAGGGGFAALASAAAPIAAAAAAVGGVLFGLAATIGTAQAAIKNGIQGGAKEGTWTHWLGTGTYNPFAYLSSFRNDGKGGIARDAKGDKINERDEEQKSNKAVARAERARLFHIERNANIDSSMNESVSNFGSSFGKTEQMASRVAAIRMNAAKASSSYSNAELANNMKIMVLRNQMNMATTQTARDYLASQISVQESVGMQLNSQKLIADDAARIREISQQRSTEERKIMAFRAQIATLGAKDQNIKDLLNSRMEESSQKVLQLTEQRGEAEKSIAQTRAQAARAALDSARQELDTVTSRIKSERDALLTAQERFGMMSRGDQNDVMQILKQARGGKQLTTEQIGKLRGLGTQEAERLAGQQARNLAKGDYSQADRQLVAIEQQRATLRDRMLDLTQGTKVSKYGERHGADKFLSKRQKDIIQASEYGLEELDRREQAVRQGVLRDQQMRSSIFGEERGNLSRSLSQKASLEAQISQQITVVAKFDRTAEQAAAFAAEQMMQAINPWMTAFQRETQKHAKEIGDLQKLRYQTAGGRG